MKFMVDSGAFSAWKLGRRLEVEPYADFIQQNSDWIHRHVNLDIIIPDDPERAAEESFKNLAYMRGRGLEPMAVFHARENISWLDRMLDAGCKYIGLGGRSLPGTKSLDEWYDLAWARIGSSGASVHALGETRVDALTRYPWASADSVSWTIAMRFGTIFLPDGRMLGAGQSTKDTRSAPDISTLTAEDLAYLEEVLRDAGLTMADIEVRQGQQAILVRAYLAARTFINLERAVRAAPAAAQVPAGLLFATAIPARQEEFTLFLGISTNAYSLPVLHRAGADAGLVSYYYIRDQHDGFRGVIKSAHLRAFSRDSAAAARLSTFSKSSSLLDKVLNR